MLYFKYRKLNERVIIMTVELEKLNPDLTYNKGIIKLEVNNDGEGNPLCRIVLDDAQELVVTEFELLELRNILNENIQELQEYFTQVAESVPS